MVDELAQPRALGLGGAKPLLQRRADAHRGDGLHQAADLGFQRLEQARRCGGLARRFALHVGEECSDFTLQQRHRVGAQQVIAHLGQQSLVEHVAPDGHRRRAHGRAAVPVGAAAVALGIDRRESRTAGVAPEHAGEQRARDGALAGARAARGATSCAVLHAPPQLVAHDAQLGLLAGLPLRRRALDIAALPRLRVFLPLPPVPHHAADVQHVEALGEGVGHQRLAAGAHRQRRRAADAFVSE
ncbi:MAG TPA: hypothetical protein VK305_14980 [Roseateles sp.]|nr:hypothetical protein [Roseateles sp.]